MIKQRMPMHEKRTGGTKTFRAILTDVQFWIPAVVLAMGVALLVFIHGN
jgi:hypothetical protein